jgi:hypothetical protein
VCTAEEVSAAIPIPSKEVSAGEDRDHFHGKHMNSRPGTSQDPTAENSSVSSTGTLGSVGGVIPGSTPPLGKSYSHRTTSRDRDAQRRSFQLPPHAEHGETAYVPLHAGLNQYGTPEQQYAHQQSPSQRHSPAQATSLDSYAGLQQMHRMEAEGGSRTRSFRLPSGVGGEPGQSSHGLKSGVRAFHVYLALPFLCTQTLYYTIEHEHRPGHVVRQQHVPYVYAALLSRRAGEYLVSCGSFA